MSFEYEFISPADLPKFGIDYSRPHLWRLIRAGKFPQPLQYSPRKRHWRRADVEAWLADRHATAQPTVPPKDALTKALDSNPLPSEAEHETATA